MILFGAVTCLALSPLGGQTAQYGRHAATTRTSESASSSATTSSSSGRRRRRGFSPFAAALPSSLPAKWAWFTQELPALLLAPLAFALTHSRALENEGEAGKSRWWFSSSPPPQKSSLPLLVARAPLPNKLLLFAFSLHYFWRSLFYPFLIRGGKETRTLEWALALLFCCWNGALQGCGAALVGRRTRKRREKNIPSFSSSSSSSFSLVLFGISLCLWALFWGLNLAADAHLRSLRKKTRKTRRTAKTTAAGNGEGEREEAEEEETTPETEEEEEDRGYRLPSSRLFSLIACPNYAAECAEWGSFAAAALFASRAAAGVAGGAGGRGVVNEALPSLAFALFTASNLVPRALAHRRWYAEKFEDFPRGRKAIFPWVL